MYALLVSNFLISLESSGQLNISSRVSVLSYLPIFPWINILRSKPWGPLTQEVEYLSFKQGAIGLSPARPTFMGDFVSAPGKRKGGEENAKVFK